MCGWFSGVRPAAAAGFVWSELDLRVVDVVAVAGFAVAQKHCAARVSHGVLAACLAGPRSDHLRSVSSMLANRHQWAMIPFRLRVVYISAAHIRVVIILRLGALEGDEGAIRRRHPSKKAEIG